MHLQDPEHCFFTMCGIQWANFANNYLDIIHCCGDDIEYTTCDGCKNATKLTEKQLIEYSKDVKHLVRKEHIRSMALEILELREKIKRAQERRNY